MINILVRNGLLELSEQACGPDEVARCTRPDVEGLIDYRLPALF